jgi:phosphate starvation-inducible membrane PsiE
MKAVSSSKTFPRYYRNSGSTLNTEVFFSLETLVVTYQTTRYHNAKLHNMNLAVTVLSRVDVFTSMVHKIYAVTPPFW